MRVASKLPSDLNLRLLGYEKIKENSLEILEFGGEYPANRPPKRQILTFVLENREKQAVKHSVETPILLEFREFLLIVILCAGKRIRTFFPIENIM